MDAEVKAALLARYKALCEVVDDYRNRGMEDEATKLAQGELKMVLDLLAREGTSPLMPSDDGSPGQQS